MLPLKTVQKRLLENRRPVEALMNKDCFYGLPLDQDNEDELTLGRLVKWVKQLKNEIAHK